MAADAGVVATFSCGITLSQPAGIMPPVMMRTHSPALASPLNGTPANAVPAPPVALASMFTLS